MRADGPGSAPGRTLLLRSCDTCPAVNVRLCWRRGGAILRVTLAACADGQLGLVAPFAVVISAGCRAARGAGRGGSPCAQRGWADGAAIAPGSARPARKRACFVPRRTPVRRVGAALARGAGRARRWRRFTVITWSDSNCNAPRTRRDAERVCVSRGASLGRRSVACVPAVGGAPEDLEWERVLGRSPVAAYAVRRPIRVAHPGWARDRSSVGCITPGCPRLAAGISRSVISWVKRLTKTERLRKSMFAAATGRRAVEHPPRSGFYWRRGFALSVVIVTGHLPTPRRWGTRVSRGGLSMTRDASFKKVVRRHAGEAGQRYTAALTDLEGLGARMHHEPVAERLLAHLRDRSGIDPAAATKLSVHKTYVFRIDRYDGGPWVARAFPPARPRAGVEGDAAILRFLERHDFPPDRLAADDAVSDFDGSAVLVTRFVEGARLPDGAAKFAMMGELLGRLHALPSDDSVSRPGGASGEDPGREGTPRQDLLAALSRSEERRV